MAWISLSTTFRVLSCALLLSTVSADGLRGRRLASSCKFKAPGQMRGKTECGREDFCEWDMTKNAAGGGECADRFICKFKAPGQMRGKKECGRTDGCSWDKTKSAAGGGECSEFTTSCKLKAPGQMRGKRECGRTDGCSWDKTKNAAGGGECVDGWEVTGSLTPFVQRCCKINAAKCDACRKGLTVKKFCELNPSYAFPGCPKKPKKVMCFQSSESKWRQPGFAAACSSPAGAICTCLQDGDWEVSPPKIWGDEKSCEQKSTGLVFPHGGKLTNGSGQRCTCSNSRWRCKGGETKCNEMCNIRGLFPCGIGLFGRPETVHRGGFAWCCTEGATNCAAY